MISDPKALRDTITKCISLHSFTPSLFRGMIKLNPFIAAECMHILASLPTSSSSSSSSTTTSSSSSIQAYLDIILQSPLSVAILHVASQLLRVDTLPRDFFRSFVDRSLQRLAEIRDSSLQIHLAQCYCVLIAGVFHKKTVDEKVRSEWMNEWMKMMGSVFEKLQINWKNSVQM